MPCPNPEMDEGKVVAWPGGMGATVRRGEVVLVVEIDKAEVEVEASISGVVRHHYAHPGDVVRCGALLAAMTTSGAEPFDAVAFELEESGL